MEHFTGVFSMQLEQLGPYRIGRQLGRGGMGTVYEGVELATSEPAAIKVLSAVLAQQEGFRERFEAEIESLRKLKHPNIVRLFGFGEQDGHLFYAMELVVGRSLEEQLQSGRVFQWTEAVGLAVQVCRALKHAHDRGVIHRDIKPANLLLGGDGTLKLSDFGIAKLFGNTSLTADGGVVGTAEYMAPEQADGRPVTHRCDLYSLGGVLYALLARRPPFRAATLVEMLQLQRYAQPEGVRRYAPEVPERLEAIIGLLLEKEPDRRIATATVLARRLDELTETSSAASNGSASAEGNAEEEDDFIVTAPTAAASDLIPPDVDVPRGDSLAKDSGGAATQGERTLRGDGSSAAPAGAAGAGWPAATRAGHAADAAVPQPPARHFTLVRDADAADQDEPEEGPAWISPQTYVLAASLIAFGLTTWYFLQPPSLDRLYERVEAKAGADELTGAEADIQAFLSRCPPSDPRARQLEAYREQIELDRLERKIALRLRRFANPADLTAVERAYAESLQLLSQDPEASMEKMQALVNVYGNSLDDDSPITRQCVELARRKLLQMRREVQRYAPQHLDDLQRRLALAEELSRSNPEAALAMWKGIVELYGGKAWASPAVKQAKAALSALSQAKN